MKYRKEFEDFLNQNPHLKGGNSFDTTKRTYGREVAEHYASSWMQGTYEAFVPLFEKQEKYKKAFEWAQQYVDCDDSCGYGRCSSSCRSRQKRLLEIKSDLKE